MSKGTFVGIFDTTPETFVTIAHVKSDGKDFCVEIPDEIIPYINQLCIDNALDTLQDAFYRVRPDLRKQ